MNNAETIFPGVCSQGFPCRWHSQKHWPGRGCCTPPWQSRKNTEILLIRKGLPE